MELIIDNYGVVFFCVVILIFICLALLRFSSSEEDITWLPMHIRPEKLESKNYSGPVIIKDYDDHKFSYVGFYDYSRECWVILSNNDLPKDFKWKPIKR